MHTPAAYGQWSVFDHSGNNQSAVPGTRYGIWWPWYGQFEVGWLQPLQLWLGAGTSSVVPVLVSQDRDLCHAQIHPTWFEPTSECRSWPVVSYLYSGHLPAGLCLGRGSLLLVGPLPRLPTYMRHSASIHEEVTIKQSTSRPHKNLPQYQCAECLPCPALAAVQCCRYSRLYPCSRVYPWCNEQQYELCRSHTPESTEDKLNSGARGDSWLVLDSDAQHRQLTRNAAKGKKGDRNYRYTFCQILPKNRGRNTAFSLFLLKHRGRNYNALELLQSCTKPLIKPSNL